MLHMLYGKLKQYYKKKHLNMLIKRGLDMGKNIQIEGNIHIDPSHCFLIRIEDNCFFGPDVHIFAHEAGPFRYLGITKLAKVTIKENSGLGLAAVVMPGVTIGPNSIVGAYSVVTRDVPPNSIAVGNPVKIVASMDDYLERHAKDEKKYRTFHESQYNIRWISSKGRKEMLDYLSCHPMAYIKGENPDVSIFNSKVLRKNGRI